MYAVGDGTVPKRCLAPEARLKIAQREALGYGFSERDRAPEG